LRFVGVYDMTFYFRFSPSAVAVHLSFDQTYGQNQL